MAANLADHGEITVFKVTTGLADLTMTINEKAGQTFFRGVPIQVTATGVVQEWDGATVAGGSGTGIAGISLAFGNNLGSDGAGAPTTLSSSVGAPGAAVTFGKVPFQPSAVNIPRGAPFVDGRQIFSAAVDETIFIGQVDNSAFAAPADATPVQADIGKEFGMTKDATGHWYVDRAKTTVGTNTVVVIIGLDPVVGSALNANVLFYFKTAATQFGH